MTIPAENARHGIRSPAAPAQSAVEAARQADRRRPFVMAAIHLALVWAMAAGVMWQSYRDAVDGWKVAADNIALTVAAQVKQTQGAAELVLSSMVDWVTAQDATSAAEFRAAMVQRSFYDVMRDRIVGQRHIGVALALAPDGDVLLTTRGYPAMMANLAENASFRAVMAPDAPPTTLTAANEGSSDGNHRFFMGRKVRSRGGEIVGVVAVGLESKFYADFFRQVALGADSWVSLFRADGTLLATSLADQTLLGKRYENASSYRLLKAGTIGKPVLVTEPPALSARSSQTRIVDVRTVEDFPVFVAVVVGERAYLDQWWTRNLLVMAIALALTGLTILAARRALRLIAESEAANLVAAERQVLQAIVETPSALTAVIDRDGIVVHSNQRFRELLKCADDPARVLSDPAIKGAEALLAFARGGAQGLGEAELAVERPSEPALLLRFSLSRHSFPDSGACVVAVGHDETMRRQAERTIAMSGKLVTLGEMASGIAHELSQPLNVIRMAAQNALAEAKPGTAAEAGDGDDDFKIEPMADDAFRDFAASKLRRIVGQVDRAAAIISRMRIFSRTSREGPQAFDARIACDGAATMLAPTFRRADVVLVRALGGEPLMAVGNVNMLEQAIVNLLTNARDALATARPGTREVALAARRGADGRILVQVSDNGPGVPAAIRDRIFEPFFTTRPVGEGTGLGLAMAYGLVRDMGGVLSLLPDGPGATFQIELPAVQ